ncbi:hypothetical protein WR25_10556 [Diploscapter pachys]|uniref:Carbohydrate sulfotransferase n=1 Tax=Diploscapter pachys TaxID=2018661 RepID=A0A2A2JTD0_9BILA|nr:hypothetical protein WR25_10556 [Diploscapter pachys]
MTWGELCDPEGLTARNRPRCIPPRSKFFPTFYVVAPVYKLFACTIHKSMTMLLTAIMCYLSDSDMFIQADKKLATEVQYTRFCEGRNEFNRLTIAKENMSMNGWASYDWSMFAITRDPVDRFLSGFLDLCVRTNSDCHGCGANLTCFLENTYRRAMALTLEDNSTLREQVITPKENWTYHQFQLDPLDLHIFPQHWRCEFDKNFASYKKVRYSSDPMKTLWPDMQSIFEKAGVPKAKLDYIKSEITSTRTVHSTVQYKARKYIEKRLRSSPYLMELLVRLFYYDYKFFNWQLPEL